MSSQGSQLVVVVTFFLLLTATTVALRCYVRLRITGGFGADDALSVASLVFFILGSICLLIGVGTGSFGHMWMSLSHRTLVVGLKLLFVYEASYVIATCLVKLSICLFLLRFTLERKHTFPLYGVFAVTLSYSIFLLFFALFQCKPVSAFWDPQGNCNRPGTIKVTYAHSAVVSACDLVLVLVPIFIVHHLPLGFRTKVCVWILLALGSCASIATWPRFAYVHDLIDPKNLFFNIGLILTSHLEIGIALTASSVATLRPLLMRLRGVSSDRTQSYRSDQDYLSRTESVGRYPHQAQQANEINVELSEES